MHVMIAEPSLMGGPVNCHLESPFGDVCSLQKEFDILAVCKPKCRSFLYLRL